MFVLFFCRGSEALSRRASVFSPHFFCLVVFRFRTYSATLARSCVYPKDIIICTWGFWCLWPRRVPFFTCRLGDTRPSDYVPHCKYVFRAICFAQRIQPCCGGVMFGQKCYTKRQSLKGKGGLLARVSPTRLTEKRGPRNKPRSVALVIFEFHNVTRLGCGWEYPAAVVTCAVLSTLYSGKSAHRYLYHRSARALRRVMATPLRCAFDASLAPAARSGSFGSII